MTSDKAILDLMADLYRQIVALRAENQQLRAEVARLTAEQDDCSSRRRRRRPPCTV